MSEINTWPGWRCVKRLGAGTFGQVYEIETGEDNSLRKAALKVLSVPVSRDELQSIYDNGLATTEQEMSTYLSSQIEDVNREFRTMYELRCCKNIVEVQGQMEMPHQGWPGSDILIRMELLTPLSQFARKYPLNHDPLLVRLGADICRALEACHNHRPQILHRDIKPANIMVASDGTFKLGDFGVARALEGTRSAHTKAGTEDYMAPEVQKCEGYRVTADIYSLGMVLYRLMNKNRFPFLPLDRPISDVDRAAAREKILAGVPLPEPADGGPRLKKVILKALSYRPADRYQSAEDFREAITACMNTDISDEEFARLYLAAPETGAADEEGTVLLDQDGRTVLLDQDGRTVLLNQGGGTIYDGTGMDGSRSGRTGRGNAAGDEFAGGSRRQGAGGAGRSSYASGRASSGSNKLLLILLPIVIAAVVVAAVLVVRGMGSSSDSSAAAVSDQSQASGQSQSQTSDQPTATAASGQAQATTDSGTGSMSAVSMSAISNITASSYTPVDSGVTYYASNLIDNSLSTCWSDGVSGIGIGETITINFDKEYLVSGLTIYNGYQKSSALYYGNARVKEMSITFSDGTSLTVTLNDTTAMQQISFSEDVNTSSLVLEVVSAYSGNKYQDVCLSELEVYAGEPKRTQLTMTETSSAAQSSTASSQSSTASSQSSSASAGSTTAIAPGQLSAAIDAYETLLSQRLLDSSDGNTYFYFDYVVNDTSWPELILMTQEDDGSVYVEIVGYSYNTGEAVIAFKGTSLPDDSSDNVLVEYGTYGSYGIHEHWQEGSNELGLRIYRLDSESAGLDGVAAFYMDKSDGTYTFNGDEVSQTTWLNDYSNYHDCSKMRRPDTDHGYHLDSADLKLVSSDWTDCQWH